MTRRMAAARRAAASLVAAGVLACGGAPSHASGGQPAGAPARCGWWDQPTPGNATLADRDGEWTVGMQGGHQARGRWPVFPKDRWVRTGTAGAGYGCVCLHATVDAGTQEVAEILSSRALPLANCRKDGALRAREPENPLR